MRAIIIFDPIIIITHARQNFSYYAIKHLLNTYIFAITYVYNALQSDKLICS